LVVKGANAAIEFYTKAFGAKELYRMPMPDGRIAHAHILINGAGVMLCDEFPEYGGGCRSPQSIGGTSVSLHLQVADVDAAYAHAVEAGATATMPPQNMFWGDRYGKLDDPFGHSWSLATKVEEVTPEQMQERMAQWGSQSCAEAKEGAVVA
jgi:uncharacterized glyoxalase superfamily protein PhnB